MAIHYLTGGSAQHWDREAEFPDRCAHAVYYGIVLSRVAAILAKPSNRLVDDFQARHIGEDRRQRNRSNGIDLLLSLH
jgi:hypothetical protein